MNKNIKLKIDKYGILRCSVLAVLVLLVTVLLCIWLLTGWYTQAALGQATEAVRQTEARFQLLIDDSFRQMRIAGERMGKGEEEDIKALRSLVENGNFTDAVIIANGMQTGTDGKKVPAEIAPSYARYEIDGAECELVGLENSIQLRIPVSNSVQLAAWMDLEQLRSILGSTYEGECFYAIYNVATGAFLINETPFSEDGYYNALLNVNRRGSTEALLQSDSATARVEELTNFDDSYYIAHRRTAVRSWGIALMVPEKVLIQDAGSLQPELAMVLLASFLLICCLVLCACCYCKAIRMEKQHREQEIRMANQLLRQAAECARCTIYVYNRREDRILTLHDGLQICRGDVPTTLNQLAQAYSLNAADVDRLEEGLRDLSAGGNAQVASYISKQDDEKLLLFTLNCSEQNEDMIVGSIRDCTQERQNQNRAMDEENFRRMMLSKAISIWQVDVSRNCWRFTDGSKGYSAARMGIRNKNWRDYDGDLNGRVRDFVQQQDFNAYAEMLNRSALTNAFMAGKRELVVDYRTRSAGNREAEWHRQIVHLFSDPDSGHIMANLYVLNIDAEKNAAIERGERKRVLQQALTALGSIYYGLYYVDLDGGLCYTAKSQGGELVTQLCTPYKSTFDDYIDRAVHPEDREALRKLLDAYNVRKNVTEDSHLIRLEYRRLVGDQYKWAAAVVQAARFENGTIRDVIIALRSIEREKKTGDGWL